MTTGPYSHWTQVDWRAANEELRAELDAAKRAHLACQEAWEQQRALLAGARRMAAQLNEIRDELMAELECERLDSHGLNERCKALEAELAGAIPAFVARVNARAEAEMLAGRPNTGAHHRALQAELEALRG